MDMTPTAHITLPIDMLILVIEYLALEDLVSLSSTCRILHLIVQEFGWSIYLRNNRRHSFTLHSVQSRWPSLALVRYNTLTDRAWSRGRFIARPLSRPWHGKLQPTIAISFSRLLVAAGCIIYSYGIRDGLTNSAPTRLVYEGSYAFTITHVLVGRDITSMTFLPDAGNDRTVSLGFEDGYVERVYLPPHDIPRTRVNVEHPPNATLQYHGSDVVESLSCSSHTLLSLSQWGSVSLTDISTTTLSSTSINLNARSWASHLCMSASSPYASLGTTSLTPLSVHHVSPCGISPTPFLAFCSPRGRVSAVYGITCAPPSSPLGSSQQILVSGWYEGVVRIYDLRASDHIESPLSQPGTSSPLPTLRPVLTLQDPWSPEPIYAVSCGGGSASFVGAGTSRHSVVAFWDVRQPSRGWSVHAPGNDSSPVYSIVLESSRFFGATQSRSFVYDFGPGVTKDTYPDIVAGGRRGSTEDRLNLKSNGIGYHVSQYSHAKTGIF